MAYRNVSSISVFLANSPSTDGNPPSLLSKVIMFSAAVSLSTVSAKEYWQITNRGAIRFSAVSSLPAVNSNSMLLPHSHIR